MEDKGLTFPYFLTNVSKRELSWVRVSGGGKTANYVGMKRGRGGETGMCRVEYENEKLMWVAGGGEKGSYMGMRRGRGGETKACQMECEKRR